MMQTSRSGGANPAVSRERRGSTVFIVKAGNHRPPTEHGWTAGLAGGRLLKEGSRAARADGEWLAGVNDGIDSEPFASPAVGDIEGKGDGHAESGDHS